jgi:hypothetical protein
MDAKEFNLTFLKSTDYKKNAIIIRTFLDTASKYN